MRLMKMGTKNALWGIIEREMKYSWIGRVSDVRALIIPPVERLFPIGDGPWLFEYFPVDSFVEISRRKYKKAELKILSYRNLEPSHQAVYLAKKGFSGSILLTTETSLVTCSIDLTLDILATGQIDLFLDGGCRQYGGSFLLDGNYFLRRYGDHFVYGNKVKQITEAYNKKGLCIFGTLYNSEKLEGLDKSIVLDAITKPGLHYY